MMLYPIFQGLHVRTIRIKRKNLSEILVKQLQNATYLSEQASVAHVINSSTERLALIITLKIKNALNTHISVRNVTDFIKQKI